MLIQGLLYTWTDHSYLTSYHKRQELPLWEPLHLTSILSLQLIVQEITYISYEKAKKQEILQLYNSKAILSASESHFSQT